MGGGGIEVSNYTIVAVIAALLYRFKLWWQKRTVDQNLTECVKKLKAAVDQNKSPV